LGEGGGGAFEQAGVGVGQGFFSLDLLEGGGDYGGGYGASGG